MVHADCLPGGTKCWVVGDSGTILATSDGGAIWKAQTSGTDKRLLGVQFLSDGRTGWAVGSNGTILATTDGGATWKPQTSGTEDILFSIQFLTDGRTGWAVGAEGTVLATGDGGATWQTRPSGTDEYLFDVQFLTDGRTGWAVDQSGTILATTDGGATWQAQPSGKDRYLSSVHIQPDGKIGWVSTLSGDYPVVFIHSVILQTLDGGENWERLSYRHLPAPWVLYVAFPALLFAFFGSLVVSRDLGNARPLEGGIEGAASTDQPIGWDDPDHVQIKPLARAISRFLRNANTKPPLTIAITGQWGKGKSSLMNLIAEDLKRHDARPVWFNAWHHQKESHLLAALLENIRAQAVPGWWLWSGLALRARLIYRRSRRDLAALAALLFIAALALGLLLLARGSMELAEWLTTLNTFLRGELSILTVGAGLGLTGGGVLFLGLIFRAARKLKAISVNPAALMAFLSRRASIAQFSDQLGFRYRFAAEFNDICRILHDTSNCGMVIMIDDLDRCRPESVLEILEAVNFLASAGPCFIFLGIDTPKVRDAVAYGFKDSILDLSGSDAAGGKTIAVDAAGLAEFADNYLKKLINIPVAVPTLTEEESRDFARSPQNQQPEGSPSPERIRSTTRTAVDFAGAALSFGIIIWFAILIVGTLPEARTGPTPDAASTNVGATVSSSSATPAGQPATPPVALVEPVAEPTVKAAELHANVVFDVLALLAIVALAIMVYISRRATAAPEGAVYDTKTFGDAQELWNPAIFAANPTPRDMKRHHNRLRFNAMRLRQESVKPGWLDKKFNNTEQQQPEVTQISDPILVALGAIEAMEKFAPKVMAIRPEDFKAKAFDTAVQDKLRQLNGASEPTTNAAEKSIEPDPTILDEFRDKFPDDWPPSKAEFAQYLDLARTLDEHPSTPEKE